MWIMSSKKNALINVESLFVSPKKDRDDETKILGWRLMGMVSTGRSIPLSSHKTEQDAINQLIGLANGFDFIQA